MWLPATCGADVLSIYTGMIPKLSSEPSFNIMLEQNIVSFIDRAATTSSASIVECAVSLYSSTLRLIRASASITMYGDVDLPFSGLLPQFASEKAATLKPFSL